MAFQQGYLYQKFGSWHLRYRTGGKQRSKRICDGSLSKNAARRLAAPFLAELNLGCDLPMADQAIVAFWTDTFEPFIAGNKKASTLRGYRQLWAQHLLHHFGHKSLRQYRAHDATIFLTSLALSYGRHTLQHVRSLMSAIFKHAVAIGACPHNPIHDCTILGNTKAPGLTKHYTLEEAEDAIAALVDKPDAQLIFALAFFCGLRPSEIAAVQWGDFDSDFVHIRRAVCAGVVGTPKTASSVRSIPLIGAVKVLLQSWRTKSPSQHWLFPDGDRPRDITSYMNRAAGSRLKDGWKGLYAARRGFATVIASNSTDGGLSLMHLMGHKTLDVTIRNYVKRVPEDLVRTMQLIERGVTSKETLQ